MILRPHACHALYLLLVVTTSGTLRGRLSLHTHHCVDQDFDSTGTVDLDRAGSVQHFLSKLQRCYLYECTKRLQ